MIELLEFTYLMQLFSLFAFICLIVGVLETFIFNTPFFFIVGIISIIILIFWFFIHNAILIYNITNK